jgi:hypothetical protein
MTDKNVAQKVVARANEILEEVDVLEDIKDMTDVMVTGVNLKHRIQARRERVAIRTAVKEITNEAVQAGEGVQVTLKEAIKELTQ